MATQEGWGSPCFVCKGLRGSPCKCGHRLNELGPAGRGCAAGSGGRQLTIGRRRERKRESCDSASLSPHPGRLTSGSSFEGSPVTPAMIDQVAPFPPSPPSSPSSPYRPSITPTAALIFCQQTLKHYELKIQVVNQVQGLGPSKPSDSGSSPNDTIYLCNFRVGGEEKAKCTKNNPLSTSLKATHTYILSLLHFFIHLFGPSIFMRQQCNTALDHPAHDIVKKNTKCIKPWSKVEKNTYKCPNVDKFPVQSQNVAVPSITYNTVQYHANSCIIMKYHTIFCHNMKVYAIPCIFHIAYS